MTERGLPYFHVHSAYSFLAGANDPEALVAAAAQADVPVMALTDWHRVSGLVQFLVAAERAGIRGVAGATVNLEDGGELVLLVPEAARYEQLVRLLTQSLLQHPRGAPRVTWQDLEQWGPGLVALSGGRRGPIDRALAAGRRTEAEAWAMRCRAIFGRDFYLEVSAGWLPGDRQIRQSLRDLGDALHLDLIAAPEVRHARREDFAVYDLLTCIGQHIRVEDPHPARPLNAEAYLKPRRQVARALGALAAPALKAADQLAERLESPRLLGVPRLPRRQDGDADQVLAEKVWAGARRRYGARWQSVAPRIRHELAIIRELGYADYFLVVEDVVRFAASRGIRYAGRGSAADSVVAYCLDITTVDAAARNLLFERFLSRERAEVPDIDIDFDARRRDEVAAYVEQRYGTEHVAAVATYQTFQARQAVRQVGKALGFPIAELDRLAKSLPAKRLGTIAARWEEIPELRALQFPPAYRSVVEWAARVEGLPRHLGTHLGGLIISGEPLSTVTPVEWSAKGVRVSQFDKRDVEALGLLKLDLLSLRTFTAIELADAAMRGHDPAGIPYAAIPPEDPGVYQRLKAADSIGVFQLESPAQRALARRLQPDRYEDLVASLALIRPGPIKGNMVDPFVARRRGREPVTYLHPALEPILRKTYGVVLFQEQVIAIASALAGFTPGEADQLRRVMTHGRSAAVMAELGEQFKAKAIARGVDRLVAEAVFGQIVGYASYGFNEAHAAAFADTAYRTAYLLAYYPGPYYTGLLNAQPMGYYPEDVLVTEARRRGIAILPVDINASEAEFSWVADRRAIRVGLGAVKAVGMEAARRIVAAREADGPFRSPQEVMARAAVTREQVGALVRVGAFDPVHPDRDGWWDSLWSDNALGLTPTRCVELPLAERLAWDYRLLGFGQPAQLMAVWRPMLQSLGFVTAETVPAAEGERIRMAGCLIRPHRPPTRSGRLIVFFSLLDETGLADAALGETGYQRFGHWLFSPNAGRLLAVEGRVRRSAIWVDRIVPWPPR
jgi:error-prone DNA polymerase